MADKPPVSLAFVGTRGCGKTTAAAQLSRLLGGFAEGPAADCRELAKELGCPHAGSAWMLDRLTDERERGLTLDTSFATFESEKFSYTAIDVAGDRLLKGVLGAASLADVAVLVLSAAVGEYEAGIDGGNVREVALTCITMGIKNIVVLVTKMDDPSVDYSQTRFDEIKRTVSAFLKDVGYKQKEVPIVPISGVPGDNLVTNSADMPWYKGTSAVDAFDTQGPINRPAEKPLRLPVLKVMEVPGSGTVIVGRVETGDIRAGVKVMFAPGGLIAEVESVQVGGQSCSGGKPGDIVSFSIGDSLGRTELRPGMVVSSVTNDPAVDTEYFIAQIIVLDHPGSIRAGYCPAIAVGTAQVPCEFEELIAKIDRKTGKEAELKPESAKSSEVVTAKLRPRTPLCIESFSSYPMLGRFAVRDHGRTVAIGVVKEVTKRPVPKVRSADENKYFDS